MDMVSERVATPTYLPMKLIVNTLMSIFVLKLLLNFILVYQRGENLKDFQMIVIFFAYQKLSLSFRFISAAINGKKMRF
jgi:hypothetical protein